MLYLTVCRLFMASSILDNTRQDKFDIFLEVFWYSMHSYIIEFHAILVPSYA